LIADFKPEVLLLDLHLAEKREFTPALVKLQLASVGNVLAVSFSNDAEAKALAESYGAKLLLDKMSDFELLCPQASGWGLSGFHASWSPIQASTRVGSVGMSRTRGNADRANLHRVREAQVGMAIADRKGECRTADQFYCGGIFSCNSDNSKSTEASITLWRETGLAVTNNAKTHQIENVQKGTQEKLTFCSLSVT